MFQSGGFKKFKICPRCSAGFTLIDLVVSATILTIIMSFVLANFRGANRNDINITLSKFLGDIRQAQTQGLAGKIVEVCYEEEGSEFALGLCEKIPDCGFCKSEYPKSGYGVSMDKCFESPCQYSLFSDVDNDGVIAPEELLPGFPSAVLGETSAEQICYSTQTEPDLPPFAGSSCATGWTDGDFFGAVFQSDQVFIKTKEPLVNEPEIKYIAVRFRDRDRGRQAFFYISVTGLISSGILE